MTSEIKVDNIKKVSDGTNIIKKCGSTVTIGSGSGQTIVADGATVTLGRCGGAVNLASGATQTGFGRTGTVDWCTTAKTSPFTAVSGDGFFVDTTSGAITVTLPASPSQGDIVALKDYANTWDDNNVTLARNGSKINGVCQCATLDVESTSITLIYVDGTKGWQDIHDSTSNVTGGAFLSATGGTVATVCTNFKVHTFTGDGTFCVSSGGGPKGRVDFLVVAGGGGGGGSSGPASHNAGGGAGGYRESKCSAVSGCWSESPLATAQSLTMSPGPFTITVGGGGPGGSGSSSPGITGTTGTPSVFSTITSAGGGGGGSDAGSSKNGLTGGSGGGAGGSGGTGGAGNTPSVNPPQGNTGGNAQSPWGGPLYSSGGGGGAGAVGTNGTPSGGGAGGAGVTSSIDNTPTARGGGGGGQQYNNSSRPGGSGGGGAGGPGGAGSNNTGGGGGGGSGPAGSPGGASSGGNGGSGIVIIRYKFQ